MCFFEYTCQECGDFADPACMDPKHGIICEDCCKKLNPKEPKTVNTVKMKKPLRKKK